MYLPNIDQVNLTKNEKTIYNFILSKGESIYLYTEIDISKNTGVSQPTVSRFWRKIGFNNFKEFKENVKTLNISPTPSEKFKSTLSSDKFNYKNYLNHTISLLESSVNKLDEDKFNKAVNYFINSRKIFTHGIGPSESLCELLKFRLKRFGLNVSCLPSTGQNIYEELINTCENDLFVLFLFSHYHPETYVIIDFAKKNNIKLVLITDMIIKPFEDENIITLYISRGELFEFHSLTGPLFLIESLIVSIGIAREKLSLEKLKKLEELRDTYEEFIPRKLK